MIPIDGGCEDEFRTARSRSFPALKLFENLAPGNRFDGPADRAADKGERNGFPAIGLARNREIDSPSASIVLLIDFRLVSVMAA